MNYTEGTSYELSDHSWFRISVNISDDDVAAAAEQWGAADPGPLPFELKRRISLSLAQEVLLRREIAEYQSRPEELQDAARGAELRARMQALVTARTEIQQALQAG